MKKNFLLTLTLSIFLATVFAFPTFSQNPPAGTVSNPPAGTTNCPGNPNCPPPSSSQAAGFELAIKLKNPLKVNTIQDAIKEFTNAVVKIAIPFIIVFFIWSGLNFILAQGNPEKLKKARTMFLNTVIGTLLILGAWAITNAIIGTINSISG